MYPPMLQVQWLYARLSAFSFQRVDLGYSKPSVQLKVIIVTQREVQGRQLHFPAGDRYAKS